MNVPLLLSLLLLGQSESVDFDNDVVPILTKAGCNAASCHGSAAGRGSFKLSLYGGDPTADYDAIVRDYFGRRVNQNKPWESLLLAKPTGELEHGGDVRLDGDGPHAALIARWVEEGAARARDQTRLVRLDVTADRIYVETVPSIIQLKAVAVYEDGKRREVNDLAVFTAEDDMAIQVTESGKSRLKRRGRHNVLVRFQTEVVALTFVAPLYDKPVDLSQAPRGNFIDDEIYASLEQLRLPPSPPADAFTMLRRLRLDLTGRFPSPEEIAALEREISKRKPTDASAESDGSWVADFVVDELLQSDDFTEFWAHQFGKWLRVGPAGTSQQNADSYHQWVRKHIEDGMPLNELAAGLITANGDAGPANFYRAAPDARGQAEHFSEVLMGVRLRCANCHNHPLDRWTQDDYHGLAALFAKLDRGKSIRYIGRGEVSHPATGEAARPKLPGDRFLDAEGDHRPALAQWLTADENSQFSCAIANRLWAAMMGRGLVEPLDDFRATNPPTHSVLLNRLADTLADGGYDLRKTLRLIATSAAYARSSSTTRNNEDDRTYYSHALRTPHSAEVLMDAIGDVTGVPVEFDQKTDRRAIALAGPASPVAELALLGQCDRKSGCNAASQANSIARELALLNGALLNTRINAPQGRLTGLLANRKSNDGIVREMYLRALSRRPTERETKFWRGQLATEIVDERRRRLEDFVWSILRCHEFTHRY